jgi:hypothetical protein
MKALALAAALVLVLTACAASPAASPTADESAMPTPSATPATTESVAPEPTPSDAAARMYPYALTWPAEELRNEWRYASTAWDGESRVDHGDQYTDVVRTSEGSLFAFGVPTDGTAEDMRDLVAEQAAEWHGCDAEPVVEEELSAGGAPGVFGQYQCRSINVLRWTGVHDGFGLFIGHILSVSADLDEASSRFKAQIAELEWSD